MFRRHDCWISFYLIFSVRLTASEITDHCKSVLFLMNITNPYQHAFSKFESLVVTYAFFMSIEYFNSVLVENMMLLQLAIQLIDLRWFSFSTILYMDRSVSDNLEHFILQALGQTQTAVALHHHGAVVEVVQVGAEPVEMDRDLNKDLLKDHRVLVRGLKVVPRKVHLRAHLKAHLKAHLRAHLRAHLKVPHKDLHRDPRDLVKDLQRDHLVDHLRDPQDLVTNPGNRRPDRNTPVGRVLAPRARAPAAEEAEPARRLQDIRGAGAEVEVGINRQQNQVTHPHCILIIRFFT